MTAGLKTIIALSFVSPLSASPHLYPKFRSAACIFYLTFFIINRSSFLACDTNLSRANPPSQVLAVGFLLVILSCALWKVYYPLLVVATYVIAPLPNWICGRLASPDDFGAEGGGSAIVDFGKFVTGGLVVMGIGESKVSWGTRRMAVVGSAECSDVEMRPSSPVRKRKRCRTWLTHSNSIAGSPRALTYYRHSSHDHVYYWRASYLWHDYHFRDVFPGGARVLNLRGTMGMDIKRESRDSVYH
jgi:hypothetical protein